MKVRIKSFNGELPDYLTEGKGYEIKCSGTLGVWIDNDFGTDLFILINGCDYLNGGSWEVIEDNTDTCTDIRNHISPNTKVIEK